MKITTLLLLMVAALSHSAWADTDSRRQFTNAWDGWNNPYKMDDNFENKLDKLPLSGNLTNAGLAWPGYYWANNKGGIAQRWTARKPEHFKYESPEYGQILTLSKEKINELSPAEKYDLYLGRYDYPTVESVWSQTRKGEDSWHGICHGVSPASLNHAEPKTVTVFNPDGIEITFYASDVKALLAYYYAKISKSKVVQVGKRCFFNRRVPILGQSSACKDVNPGSFHIIMANKLGIDKTGFIADMERYKQVWNHAAVNYESQVLRYKNFPSETSAEGTVKRAYVKTIVNYAASIDPAITPIIGTNLAKYSKKTYSYYLDLDSKGEIIGGEWISKNRPDFMWIKEKDEFTGYWSGLKDIYQN